MKMFSNQKPKSPNEPVSPKAPKSNLNHNWRVQIKKTQLVSQAATILLQRHSRFWGLLLKPLKLSTNFTPSLFHEILNKIQTHPKICFSFLKWAKKSLDFRPDPGAQCRMVRILFESGLSELGTPILNSVSQNYPPANFVPLLIQSQKSRDLQVVSPVLNSVIDFYCSKQLHLQSLEVYNMGKQFGFGLSAGTCSGLLSLLTEKNELKLAWCLYASVIRNGVIGDELPWSAITMILYKDGKFERISRFLNVGMYNPEMFDLLIDGYAQRGDFEAVFDYLKLLGRKGFKPSFSTYSSILDGACKSQYQEVIENIMSIMVKKGHFPEFRASSDYDMIIQKFCKSGRTFATDMFFKSARDENIELRDVTYECMLRALLSGRGRIYDAIELYNIVQVKNTPLSVDCYNEFVIALCKENPSQKVGNLLLDLITRGFISDTKVLSTYVGKLCSQGRFSEAEKLFDSVLGQRCLLDSISCGLLAKHYCCSRKIDRAILLHDRLKELKGNLDTTTYNVLLAALFEEKRIEKTIEVFDYMRECKKLDSRSFLIMIGGLCHETELRKAMKLHDEMLRLGLKPDKETYKKLISCFR